jgi:hypothetical protein
MTAHIKTFVLIGRIYYHLVDSRDSLSILTWDYS